MSYFVLVQLILPAVLFAGVFAYARLRIGADLDLATGASVYCAIALAISAVVLAAGAGRLVTAAFGGIDEDWTYGDPNGFSFSGIDVIDVITGQVPRPDQTDRTGRDAGSGMGLVAAGLVVGAIHLRLRRYIQASEQHDDAAGMFVEAVTLVAVGLLAITFVVAASDGVGARMSMDEGSRPSPGGAVAFAAAFSALAAFYAHRIGRELELFGRARGEGARDAEQQP